MIGDVLPPSQNLALPRAEANALVILREKSQMINRLFHAILGAILGVLVAASALWYFTDQPNWIFVSGSSGVCAILAFAWGEPFLEWLKEVWWWT